MRLFIIALLFAISYAQTGIGCAVDVGPVSCSVDYNIVDMKTEDSVEKCMEYCTSLNALAGAYSPEHPTLTFLSNLCTCSNADCLNNTEPSQLFRSYDLSSCYDGASTNRPTRQTTLPPTRQPTLQSTSQTSTNENNAVHSAIQPSISPTMASDETEEDGEKYLFAFIAAGLVFSFCVCCGIWTSFWAAYQNANILWLYEDWVKLGVFTFCTTDYILDVMFCCYLIHNDWLASGGILALLLSFHLLLGKILFDRDLATWDIKSYNGQWGYYNRLTMNVMLFMTGGSTEFVNLITLFPLNCPATRRDLIKLMRPKTLVLENAPQATFSCFYLLSNGITVFVLIHFLFSAVHILRHMIRLKELTNIEKNSRDVDIKFCVDSSFRWKSSVDNRRKMSKIVVEGLERVVNHLEMPYIEMGVLTVHPLEKTWFEREKLKWHKKFRFFVYARVPENTVDVWQAAFDDVCLEYQDYDRHTDKDVSARLWFDEGSTRSFDNMLNLESNPTQIIHMTVEELQALQSQGRLNATYSVSLGGSVAEHKYSVITDSSEPVLMIPRISNASDGESLDRKLPTPDTSRLKSAEMFDEEFGGASTSPPADGTTPGTTLPAGASSPFTGSPMVAEIIDSKRVPEPNIIDASTVSASDMESATAANGTNLSSMTATYSRMTISSQPSVGQVLLQGKFLPAAIFPSEDGVSLTIMDSEPAHDLGMVGKQLHNFPEDQIFDIRLAR